MLEVSLVREPSLDYQFGSLIGHMGKLRNNDALEGITRDQVRSAVHRLLYPRSWKVRIPNPLADSAANATGSTAATGTSTATAATSATLNRNPFMK